MAPIKTSPDTNPVLLPAGPLPADGRGKHARQPDTPPASPSSSSSQRSSDTLEVRAEQLRTRSPTPTSSLLPQPTSWAHQQKLVAQIDRQVLAAAQAAAKSERRLPTYRDGDTLAPNEDQPVPKFFSVPPDRHVYQASVATLRLISEARQPEVWRLERVLEAIADGEKLRPIKVDASGAVIDGFHRLLAAELVGIDQVTVDAPRRAPSGKSDHSKLHKAAEPWRLRRRAPQ